MCANDFVWESAPKVFDSSTSIKLRCGVLNKAVIISFGTAMIRVQ